MKPGIFLLFVVLTLSGCQSTFRKTMYSAFETIGIEKRDILKRRVNNARDRQKDASESFQDALETFKKVYAFDGGTIEKNYSKAKDAYDRSVKDAASVRSSIKDMETVAGDLFKEWDQEIDKIETSSLRSKSQGLKSKTEKQYGEMLAALRKSEGRMDPILRKLNDQVLYLKHNLNARAVTALQGEGQNIEKEIQRLLSDMQTSIQEADKFIAELD